MPLSRISKIRPRLAMMRESPNSLKTRESRNSWLKNIKQNSNWRKTFKMQKRWKHSRPRRQLTKLKKRPSWKSKLGLRNLRNCLICKKLLNLPILTINLKMPTGGKKMPREKLSNRNNFKNNKIWPKNKPTKKLKTSRKE